MNNKSFQHVGVKHSRVLTDFATYANVLKWMKGEW